MNRLDNLMAPLLGLAFVGVFAVAMASAWSAPGSPAAAAFEANAWGAEQVVIVPSRIDVVGVREGAGPQPASHVSSIAVPPRSI